MPHCAARIARFGHGPRCARLAGGATRTAAVWLRARWRDVQAHTLAGKELWLASPPPPLQAAGP